MIIRTGILSLIALFGVFEVSSRAETTEAVKIRFAQSTAIGTNWLPAGEYRISLAQTRASQPTLVVENVETRTSIFVPASRIEAHFGETPDHTGAVVQQIDGQNFVSSLWFEGQSTGYSVLSLQQQARPSVAVPAVLMK